MCMNPVITFKFLELLGAKGAKNASLKSYVEFLIFTLFEWFFFPQYIYIQQLS